MNAALETRSKYEDFVLEEDILYYRMGHHGLVSFHGNNFNVRRRLSTEQLQKITADASFYKVNADCYVNISKVRTVQDSKVYFESVSMDAKCIPIDRLKHSRLKEKLQKQLVHS